MNRWLVIPLLEPVLGPAVSQVCVAPLTIGCWEPRECAHSLWAVGSSKVHKSQSLDGVPLPVCTKKPAPLYSWGPGAERAPPAGPKAHFLPSQSLLRDQSTNKIPTPLVL